MTYLAAKRKDGTPASVGDRVLMILRCGKMFGTIAEFYQTWKFIGDKKHVFQIYKVRCDDGLTRPVYQRHIKGVFQKKSCGGAICLAA